MRSVWLFALLPLLAVGVPSAPILSQPRRLLSYDDFRRITTERRNAVNGTDGLRPVHRYNQVEWLFAFGTPKQYRSLIFDTTSTDTFVASNEFVGWGFNISNSRTAVLTGKPYISHKNQANVLGETLRDVVTFWGLGAEALNEVGLIRGYEGAEDALVPFQAGLGWRPHANDQAGPTTPLIHGFFKSYYGGDRKYQLFANQYRISIHFGGEAICSGGEGKYFELLKGKPVPMVEVESFEFGKYQNIHKYPLTFDSSIGAVMLPADSYNYVIKQYEAKFDAETGLFLIDCKADRNHEWEFTIGGKSVPFGDSEVIYERGYFEKKCALMVAKDMNAEPQYVLGTPIFGKYCVTFDVKDNKIGVIPYRRAIV